MTPAMRQVVEAEAFRLRRRLLIMAGGFAALFLLMGLLLQLVAIMSVVAAGMAAIFLGVAWWSGGKGRRAVAETSILRTAGPISVGLRHATADADEDGSAPPLYFLKLSDRSVGIPASLARQLQGLSWATVEHAKHLDLILEVRDTMGQMIFRDPRYQP